MALPLLAIPVPGSLPPNLQDKLMSLIRLPLTKPDTLALKGAALVEQGLPLIISEH